MNCVFDFNLQQLLQAFVTIFVIMDPFASTPVFYHLTKGFDSGKQFQAAKTAVFIAAGALLVFIVVGPLLFGFLGIKIEHFKIAGGIVLFLIALEYVLGITFPKEQKKVDVGIVVIGVPLITGPGVLTAAILLVNSVGFVTTATAAIVSLALTFLILLMAPRLMKIMGETGSEIFSRIMGLLLASIAVDFVLSGIIALNL
ncbi:MAG TPA: MarC family protein [Candidatus Norongarragalinales archaeon]|nr:MarC family protein [Candidatus Norongarragalinales archaeon]